MRINVRLFAVLRERAGVEQFAVELEDGEARKRLILDLATLAHQLPRGLNHLDNFEGMVRAITGFPIVYILALAFNPMRTIQAL